MSETTKQNPVAAVPSNPQEPTEEKQSFVAKTKQFVKNHKKPAIAVGALVGLVGIAAVAGRKTADLTVEFQQPLEIVPVDEDSQESDTTVA